MTAREFFIKERGISESALDRYGCTEDGAWLRFPYPNGTYKERMHDGEGVRHFRISGGSISGLFGGDLLREQQTVFICEGESDTLRLAGELGDDSPGVAVGISGVNAWKPEFADALGRADVAYVILDNDANYKTAAVVDKAWLDIRRSLGPKAKRIVLPDGVKDICEFFDNYNMDAFRSLVDRVKDAPMWHYEALDLSKAAVEPNWMVDHLIAQGDIAMMIGEPGVGKSWLSMALAVSLAEGQSSFLGRTLKGTGRVLYVDEENPEALIPWRLKRLGLTERGEKNIRYLHRQGVRLDRAPQLILEEALDFQPALIVLDSLTRIHTRDENNAGEVSGLFNDGIVPLARDTGATTLILHHVNKTESPSSFARSRGSGDLSAAIDTGLDIRGSDSANLAAHHYKSRWVAEGATIRFQIADTADGGVALVTKKDPVF